MGELQQVQATTALPSPQPAAERGRGLTTELEEQSLLTIRRLQVREGGRGEEGNPKKGVFVCACVCSCAVVVVGFCLLLF